MNTTINEAAIPMYRELASLIGVRRNCIKAGNAEWESNHSEEIITIAENLLPSGSGIDCGTEVDLDHPLMKKCLSCSFHHMNDNGCYDGWTEHQIIITPSLVSGYQCQNHWT